jgi:hypothetical protein
VGAAVNEIFKVNVKNVKSRATIFCFVLQLCMVIFYFERKF